MQIPFSKELMAKFGDVVLKRFYDKSKRQTPVLYKLDWSNNRAVQLSDWIDLQLINPSNELLSVAKIIRGLSNDETVINALKYVYANVRYMRDDARWGVIEKWQEANTTLDLKTGDCEDGAVLLYVLCRLAKIPYYQLRINCGDVLINTGIKTNINKVDIVNFGDKQCHLKKEINYGIIQTQLEQELKKENIGVLLQNLKKVESLSRKEKENAVALLENTQTKLSKIGLKFVKDVEKQILENFAFIIKTKSDMIINKKILKYYAGHVMQSIILKNKMVEDLSKEINPGIQEKNGLKKLKEKCLFLTKAKNFLTATENTGGHAWLEYRSDECGKSFFIDWCYEPVMLPIEFRITDYKMFGYKKVWWGFNEMESFKGYEVK